MLFFIFLLVGLYFVWKFGGGFWTAIVFLILSPFFWFIAVLTSFLTLIFILGLSLAFIV